MHTLHVPAHRSRFSTLLQLVRSVTNAPVGSDGIPTVLVGTEKVENGGTAIFARTADPTLDTRVVLTEKEPALLKSAVDYVRSRLGASGFKTVNSEHELPVRIA